MAQSHEWQNAVDGEGRLFRPPKVQAVPSFIDVGAQSLQGATEPRAQTLMHPASDRHGMVALMNRKVKAPQAGTGDEAKGFDIAFRSIRVNESQERTQHPAPPAEHLPPLRRVESLRAAPSRIFQRNLRTAAIEVSTQILNEIIEKVVQLGEDEDGYPQLDKLRRGPSSFSKLGSWTFMAISRASSRMTTVPKQSIVWPDRDRYEPKALIFLKLSNPLRLIAIGVTESASFRLVVILAILLSSAGLAAEDPHDALYLPEGTFRLRGIVLERINEVCAILFGIELLLNILAQGLVWGSRTYLADMWNWLDVIVAVGGLVDLAGGGGSRFAALRCIRAGRALRAIKLIPDLALLIELLGQVRACKRHGVASL
jgi:hypothetical protein